MQTQNSKFLLSNFLNLKKIYLDYNWSYTALNTNMAENVPVSSP